MVKNAPEDNGLDHFSYFSHIFILCKFQKYPSKCRLLYLEVPTFFTFTPFFHLDFTQQQRYVFIFCAYYLLSIHTPTTSCVKICFWLYCRTSQSMQQRRETATSTTLTELDYNIGSYVRVASKACGEARRLSAARRLYIVWKMKDKRNNG